MVEKDFDKNVRLLDFYTRLMQGSALKKSALAQQYGVSEKTIQRDIDHLRSFLSESGEKQQLIYDAIHHCYRMQTEESFALTNSEVLAVAKILLESRSMVTTELFPILDKLVNCCTPKENLRQVQELLANEKFHYVEPHHQKKYVDKLWEIGTAVNNQCVAEMVYAPTHSKKRVKRRIHPVGILFSEYYFYLAAFIEGIDKQEHFEHPEDKSPTIYRIDRIEEFTVLKEHFSVPYKDRFQEGEMRKRIQFMYGGELQHIKFKYTGPSVDAVLDRLPTAKVIQNCDDGVIITAEVFGKGIDMWLKSQGEWLQRLG